MENGSTEIPDNRDALGGSGEADPQGTRTGHVVPPVEHEADVDGDVPVEPLWHTVKGDLSQAKGWRIFAVVGLLVWMAFQWGWGNDILLPSIVARVFDATDDGETWASGIAAVAAGTGAGALFWGVTQAFDGIVVLTGLRLLPGITARISNFLTKKGWVKPVAELPRGTKFLIAYATGVSVLCLVDVFATGRHGLRSRGRMLVEGVGLAVAGVAPIVALITGLTVLGARVEVTADAAEVAVRYARNPVTWLVIYGTIVGISALISRLTGDKPGDAVTDSPAG